MSALPEKRKTPEEILRLRESLAGPRRPEPPVEMPVPQSDEPRTESPPSRTHSAPKPVHSLKRSERAPLKVVDDDSATAAVPRASVVPESFPMDVAPASPRSTSSGGVIPARRHDERELMEMRRRGAIEMLQPRINPRLLPANLWLLAFGYLGPAIAAACIWLADQPIEIGPGPCSLAFLSGGAIAIRRPVSRHHAAFMMTRAAAVLICAAFHYFPHLLHVK